MAFEWTEKIEQEVIRLRDEKKLSWDDIAARFGMESKHVPRIRYSRLKNGKNRGGESGKKRDLSAPMEYEIQARFAPADYDYDEATGIYRFSINDQIVKVPKDTWERIVALYANGGGDMTQAEIAMEVGMHRKVLEAMLRKYGHFKARPPVTREELAKATTEEELVPLYERAIEVKEAKFSRALDRKRLVELERINRELRTKLHWRDGARGEILDAMLSVLGPEGTSSLDKAAPEAIKIVPLGGEEWSCLINLFDTHFGMRVFGTEGFLANYNTDVAARYVRAVAREAASWIAAQPGRCVRVRLVNGGDVFHAFEKRTRRGTPLERDKGDKEVFRDALAAFKDAIEVLRQVCAVVEYDGTPGNHDGIHEWFLREALSLYFRDAKDVRVNTHERKRTYFLEGRSLHVFDHGEEFTRFDPLRLTKAELVARMIGEPFKQADKIYFYVGHTHHHEEKGWGPHLKLIRVNTFAHTNDHEEELVFYGDPEVNIYRLDAEGRIADTHTCFLLDIGQDMGVVNMVGQ